MTTFEQPELFKIKVHEYSPSQVIELAKTRPDIADHIIRGYGMTGENLQPQEIIEAEYDHGETRTRIFLAEVEGKIVGSLYFILWRNSPEDKRGGKFAEYLQEHMQDKLNLEALANIEIIACDVGIVVDPDFRGKGIVNELYSTGVASTQPAFVVGQSKTPAAVISWKRILDELGYITAYGGIPLSEDMDIKVAEQLTEAYYFARPDVAERIRSLFVHYAKTEALQPEIDIDFSKLTSEMQDTFHAILAADETRPEGKITFSPIISVKKSLVLQ